MSASPRAGAAPAVAAASAPAHRRTSAEVAAQLPQRRRHLGLGVMALGVALIALQSSVEWLLPYDQAVLVMLRQSLHWPGLAPQALAWAWAIAALAALALLGWRAPAMVEGSPSARHQVAPAAVGLLLGLAYVGAGGAAAALALLLLAGVASLGWQSGAGGGRALLLAQAGTIALADALLSAHATLWIMCLALAGLFIWIDREHISASDRRLVGALAERDALIGDLDQQREQLQLVQGARTRLLASISHDLRQPLQAVRLYAEALHGRPGQDERSRAMLSQQMQAADDAVAMLDQFSEFSAIEHGMLVSHPEVVELRELLDRVARALQAGQARARLHITVHGRRTWVWTDRTQLARVVQNLAGNAVRYSLGLRADGPARIVLAVRPHGGACALEVWDNGRGIPADKLALVFEPYVQLPQASTAEAGAAAPEAPGAGRAGRGLGLAIVRGLVTQLGLQLAPIRSQVGRGTRVRVDFGPELMRSEPAAAATTPIAPLRLDGWLLALLDDEDGPRVALAEALQFVGAEVVQAAALPALEAQLDARERFPDALVFDLDLGPGRPDGRAAIAELRQRWEHPVPALIITGRVGARSVILPKRCSMLEKPVALADVVATLRRLVPPPTVLLP